MKLAIVLITCDRVKYTRRTIESFNEHNNWCEEAPYPVHLLHIDDASETDENMTLADKYGFRTICPPAERRGNTATRRQAIMYAGRECRPTHLMFLENDWECQRAMPWQLIEWVFAQTEHDIYHLRLWHHFKSKAKFESWDGVTPLVSRGHAGRDRADPGWVPMTTGELEPVDVGDIHWGAPPAVTRMSELKLLHDGAGSESFSIHKSGELSARVAQVKTNVFFHIGDKRTPGFRK